MPASLNYKRLSIKQIEAEMVTAFRPTADQIRGMIIREAGRDGTFKYVPRSQIDDLVNQVGRVTLQLFVNADGKAFVGDSALSPFANLLNRWYVTLVYQSVKTHTDWMTKKVDADVLTWLKTRGRRVRETANPYLRQRGEGERAYQERLKQLRIFDSSSLEKYDPMHQWVDPNGYTLSQRIWDTAENTRWKMNRLLADLIAEGRGADYIATRMEQFLLPGRADIRTVKSYGGDASFDAMRLARTELARSANQAAYLAALYNPWVETIDLARSASGDEHCRSCAEHATIDIQQARVRPAYEIKDAPVPPIHPQCMCRLQSNVTATPKAVTAELREYIQQAQQDFLAPIMSPAQIDGFTRELLGDALFSLMRQVVQPPLL